MAPEIRVLSLKYHSFENKTAKSVLSTILELCPALSELRLRSYDPGNIFDTVMAKLDKLPGFNTLHLLEPPHHLQYKVTVEFFEGSAVQSEKAKLITILSQNPKLSEVQLKCANSQFLATIKLVVSMREKWKAEGHAPALRRLELSAVDGTEDIASSVHLSDGSDISDMTTTLNTISISDRDYLPSLFRQYGWSITTLDMTLKDNFVFALDKATEDRGSKLTTLIAAQVYLSSEGLNCMDRIAARSHHLQHFELFLHDDALVDTQSKPMRLLHRHKERLTTLKVQTTSDPRLPQLRKTFPVRQHLPKLNTLLIRCSRKGPFPPVSISWLAAMVSTPPRRQNEASPPILSSSGDLLTGSCSSKSTNNNNDYNNNNNNSSSSISQAWEPMKQLQISNFDLQPQDWKTVIEALDICTLETLDFSNSNFSRDELKILVGRIPDDDGGSAVLLRSVNFASMDLSDDIGDEGKSLCRALEEKAPFIRITLHGAKTSN
ncbi:hypothetical protein BGZ54_001977 [Gamsiella multidivaricata]|nr:hypothetical protein BGZ54_001977 [Gamsiella multidivaricata]